MLIEITNLLGEKLILVGEQRRNVKWTGDKSQILPLGTSSISLSSSAVSFLSTHSGYLLYVSESGSGFLLLSFSKSVSAVSSTLGFAASFTESVPDVDLFASEVSGSSLEKYPVCYGDPGVVFGCKEEVGSFRVTVYDTTLSVHKLPSSLLSLIKEAKPPLVWPTFLEGEGPVGATFDESRQSKELRVTINHKAERPLRLFTHSLLPESVHCISSKSVAEEGGLSGKLEVLIDHANEAELITGKSFFISFIETGRNSGQANNSTISLLTLCLFDLGSTMRTPSLCALDSDVPFRVGFMSAISDKATSLPYGTESSGKTASGGVTWKYRPAERELEVEVTAISPIDLDKYNREWGSNSEAIAAPQLGSTEEQRKIDSEHGATTSALVPFTPTACPPTGSAPTGSVSTSQSTGSASMSQSTVAVPSSSSDDLQQAMGSLMDSTRPKHALEGIGSGLKYIAGGVLAGTATLFAAPVAGGMQSGPSGVLTGLAKGLGGFVGLTIGGVAVGAAQIVRGIVNTPEALVNAAKPDVKWNKETGKWECIYIHLRSEYERVLDRENAEKLDNNGSPSSATRRAHNPTADSKGSKLYVLLDISSTASQAEIKKAYYRAAVKFHPDKNPDPKAPEQFQAVAKAYQILSNAESRKKYDEQGEAFADSQDQGSLAETTELFRQLDPSLFFNFLFGVESFAEFTGELAVADFVKQVIKAQTEPESDSDEDHDEGSQGDRSSTNPPAVSTAGATSAGTTGPSAQAQGQTSPSASGTPSGDAKKKKSFFSRKSWLGPKSRNAKDGKPTSASSDSPKKAAAGHSQSSQQKDAAESSSGKDRLVKVAWNVSKRLDQFSKSDSSSCVNADFAAQCYLLASRELCTSSSGGSNSVPGGPTSPGGNNFFSKQLLACLGWMYVNRAEKFFAKESGSLMKKKAATWRAGWRGFWRNVRTAKSMGKTLAQARKIDNQLSRQVDEDRTKSETTKDGASSKTPEGLSRKPTNPSESSTSSNPRSGEGSARIPTSQAGGTSQADGTSRDDGTAQPDGSRDDSAEASAAISRETMEKTVPLVMDMVWNLILADVESVSKKSCKLMLYDVSVPYVVRHARARRLRILGKAFLDVARAVSDSAEFDNTSECSGLATPMEGDEGQSEVGVSGTSTLGGPTSTHGGPAGNLGGSAGPIPTRESGNRTGTDSSQKPSSGAAPPRKQQGIRAVDLEIAFAKTLSKAQEKHSDRSK